MLSILAKLREITQFWKSSQDRLERIEEDYKDDDAETITKIIKAEVSGPVDFFIDIETKELAKFMDESIQLMEDMPDDVKTMYLAMNAEYSRYTVKHINKMLTLNKMNDDELVRYKPIQYCIESAYDYFSEVYDQIKKEINSLQDNKTLKSILENEEKERSQYYASVEYRNQLINHYKEGEKRIREYLNERCFPAGSTTRKDILAILDEMNAELNAEKDAEQ